LEINLLKKIVENREDLFSEAFALQYCRAVRMGMGKWGEKLLSGETFLLQCALMARLGKERSLQLLCLPRLAGCKDPARQIAQIAFGLTDDYTSKIISLRQFEDSATARLYERFFYSRLTDEERRRPEIVKVIVENHLSAGKFSEALPLIEKLADSDGDPQVLFWLGWCHATLGNTDQSLAALRKLQKNHLPNGNSFCWVLPKPGQPQSHRLQYHISSSGELRWLKADRLTCTDLRYGPVDSFDFSPPAWPQLPVVQQEKMDASALFRMFAVAATVFDPQETTTASMPTATRR